MLLSWCFLAWPPVSQTKRELIHAPLDTFEDALISFWVRTKGILNQPVFHIFPAAENFFARSSRHVDNEVRRFHRLLLEDIGRSEEHTSELQSRGHLV